jgi:hypothetical protein
VPRPRTFPRRGGYYMSILRLYRRRVEAAICLLIDQKRSGLPVFEDRPTELQEVASICLFTAGAVEARRGRRRVPEVLALEPESWPRPRLTVARFFRPPSGPFVDAYRVLDDPTLVTGTVSDVAT